MLSKITNTTTEVTLLAKQGSYLNKGPWSATCLREGSAVLAHGMASFSHVHISSFFFLTLTVEDLDLIPKCLGSLMQPRGTMGSTGSKTFIIRGMFKKKNMQNYEY